MRRRCIAALLALAAWRSTPAASAQDHGAPATALVRRALPDGGAIVLERDAAGDGHLLRAGASGEARDLGCERLEGAWGLWLTDVDGDGRPEALVALRKRARFDPVIANRLHVYAIAGARCVPLWRGTRLAGRFEALAREEGAPDGTVLALEQVGGGWRRVARYRWVDFGFAVERVLWRGRGALPARYRQLFP